MILHKGLWILINLDGIDGVISRTYKGDAFLTVIGPERTLGDVYSRYHCLGPEGLPTDNDTSNFAFLYRKIESLACDEDLMGPGGENHPAVYMRFEYIYEGSPAQLLTLLEKAHVVIRIRKIPHSGDDAEVAQARQDFEHWINTDTEFDPNPEIEESRKKEQEERNRKIRMEEAERWDKKFRLFVLFPILFAIIGGILMGAFSLHWSAGIATLLLMGFAWWRIQH